jgi:hypothetical protein
VADDLHQKLVIWINDAERGAVYDRYSVVPEESVRDGWHRAICRAHHACDWSTTGTDGVCDDVGYEHVAETHRSGPQAVEELQALAALRAVVVLHAPVEGLCGECCDRQADVEYWGLTWREQVDYFGRVSAYGQGTRSR